MTDCRDWYFKYAKEYPDYFPENREIVSSEEFFDITLDEEWAKFEFHIKGIPVTGQLAIKGAMDLLYKVDDNTYEYCDIKTTGSNKDWVTGKTRDYDKIKNDIQFLLYYYALRKKYPTKDISITPIYLRLKGPMPVSFDDSDITKLKKRLKENFEKIKQIHTPNNIKGNFKCTYCPFKTQIFKNNISYCDWFDIETAKVGVDLVTSKYSDNSFNNYGDGGGTKHK